MNCQVTSFRNNNNLCDSTCSLNVRQFYVIIDPFLIFLMWLVAGADNKIFQGNKWPGGFWGDFCQFWLFRTIFMFVSSNSSISSSFTNICFTTNTRALSGFLLLSLNSCYTFFVTHFIRISSKLSVTSSNLLINCFE